MATMPPRQPAGQVAGPSQKRMAWFASDPGKALLESEYPSIHGLLAQRRGHPWLWLSPLEQGFQTDGRGLHLNAGEGGWGGPVRCALPLPLASESMAVVVIQHVAPAGRAGYPLIEECARVLIPGGQCWVFALNPLSPYRWRWTGSGLRASEPMPWRWRLREAGLYPDPVSEGVGPRWRPGMNDTSQHGLGLRAAYLLRAEKRSIPLTPLRSPAPLRLGSGVPAA